MIYQDLLSFLYRTIGHQFRKLSKPGFPFLSGRSMDRSDRIEYEMMSHLLKVAFHHRVQNRV